MKPISRWWPFILAMSIVALSELAQAAHFIHTIKSGSVVAYRDQSDHSPIIGVMKENADVEIVSEDSEWYKIKVPYGEPGSFLFGFIQKHSHGTFQVISKKVEPIAGPTVSSDDKSGDSDHVAESKEEKDYNDDLYGTEGRSLKFSTGPVYSVYRYGAFQYHIGATYEQNLGTSFRIGIPFGYVLGDGFSDLDFGLQGMYEIKIRSLSITPKVGAGYGYFFGNGKSFQSFLATAGVDIEYPISKYLSLGIEPFDAQVMVWNSTDSLNKVPWNIRAESLLLIRGRW